MPTAQDFQAKLNNIFQTARTQGLPHIDVNTGDLHRSVGGYPHTNNHRMPVCWGVMRQNIKQDDIILKAPPSGDGATLTIRYFP